MVVIDFKILYNIFFSYVAGSLFGILLLIIYMILVTIYWYVHASALDLFPSKTTNRIMIIYVNSHSQWNISVLALHQIKADS
jgi:hypothetical protein